MKLSLAALKAVVGRAKSVSFSQYGEDLLLAVSLLPGASGTYVDVGAYHPHRESNTYKLYLRGWRGLTVEPDPGAAEAFRKLRPGDVHVVEGVAAQAGELTYHRFADGKLNTFSPEKAAHSVSRGRKALGVLSIPCRPLQAMIDQHLPGRRIDLLSIDCEALDFEVLQSVDFDRCRPTAILIEDYEGFHRLKLDQGTSEIAAYLRARGYGLIGQAMFSSLYVDLAAARRRERGAFDFSATQVVAAWEQA